LATCGNCNAALDPLIEEMFGGRLCDDCYNAIVCRQNTEEAEAIADAQDSAVDSVYGEFDE
jgi:hypothetical protein